MLYALPADFPTFPDFQPVLPFVSDAGDVLAISAKPTIDRLEERTLLSAYL